MIETPDFKGIISNELEPIEFSFNDDSWSRIVNSALLNSDKIQPAKVLDRTIFFVHVVHDGDNNFLEVQGINSETKNNLLTDPSWIEVQPGIYKSLI